MVNGFIYTITNLINGKMYVGLTINPKSRKKDHFVLLKANKHYNSYLQNAVNKYGIENFEFEILEDYPEDFLFSMENYWCNILNTHDKEHGYNLKCTSDSKSYRMSEETKRKISEYNIYKWKNKKERIKYESSLVAMQAARIGSKHSLESKLKMSNTKTNGRKIDIYLYNGDYVTTVNFELEASNFTKVSRTAINNNLNGLSKYCRKGNQKYVFIAKYN